MTTLITGGTGFISAYVLKRLIAKGEAVVSYDQAPNMARLKAVLGPDAGKVTVVRGDVLDSGFMLRTARNNKVDKVVHLAYIVRDNPANPNPALSTRINVDGTNNVFDMAGFAGARRVVWASSVAIFGPKSAGSSGVVGTDAPFDPLSVYGASKLTNEKAAEVYATIYGLEPIGLRFPLVYGPEIIGNWAEYLPNLSASLARGEPHPVVPRGDQVINLGYVEDIADAIVRSLEVPRPASPDRYVYTLAGYETTVNASVDMILAHFPGTQAATREDYPRVELQTTYDVSAAKTDLGWQPQVTVEEGVRRIVEHYRRLHG